MASLTLIHRFNVFFKPSRGACRAESLKIDPRRCLNTNVVNRPACGLSDADDTADAG